MSVSKPVAEMIPQKDLIIKMKVPVKTYYKKTPSGHKTNKVSHRVYEVQDVNYSEIKKRKERFKQNKIRRHRSHQERNSH